MTVISEQDEETYKFKGRGQNRPKFDMDKFDDESISDKNIKKLDSDMPDNQFTSIIYKPNRSSNNFSSEQVFMTANQSS